MVERDKLRQSIGAPLEPETVVEVMLRGPESWVKITNKREKEAEIQRMTNREPWD